MSKSETNSRDLQLKVTKRGTEPVCGPSEGLQESLRVQLTDRWHIWVLFDTVCVTGDTQVEMDHGQVHKLKKQMTTTWYGQ